MKKFTTKMTVVGMLVILFLALSGSTAFADGGRYHKVHYGENLFRIGLKYGVHYQRIAEANNLYSPHHIYAGQVLYIPERSNRGHCYYNNCGGRHERAHKVVYGETLSSIGYHYGVSPWAIARANNIYNIDHIYVGQVLHIPQGH